ncbi:hypothetical protein M422DRAFT_275241 [Sphaerobolus stellatus SS14]|uniref:DUF6532 domain-containing protein n=1 Tax=Sphaerobolus stellatus (strain SS14) TaxID=990650 RepID=A0A0C9UF17_SPHS4|nr:hypothetical protein M422DRAFT_275241 [Sphaerobolus stellatus SS14]
MAAIQDPIYYCLILACVILRQKSPFSHPFLQKVLSLVAFNPQSRLALDARFPDAFDAIRLKTLVFVCTMTHFALANLLKEKRQEFSTDEYFLVYVDYLEMDFQAEEPEEFENRLMITLADGKINLGNAEKVIPQPSQVPQGMAVAAVLAPHGSATAAVGNTFKLRRSFQVMEFLILRHMDIHQGRRLFILLFPKVLRSQTSLITDQSRVQDTIYALYLVHGVSA